MASKNQAWHRRFGRPDIRNYAVPSKRIIALNFCAFLLEARMQATGLVVMREMLITPALFYRV